MTNEEIFLRGVWKLIPDEGDTSWVQNLSKQELRNVPLGDEGVIIKEMLDKGIEPKTIARFAKIIGYETAFGIMYHLEDPNASFEGYLEKELTWGLFLTNKETGQPEELISGLHESILSMEPEGHEMRPGSN